MNEPRRTASNLWKVPLFKFLSDFLIIAPIIIPFYRSCGMSSAQILVIQAVFSLSMLIFEVPSGYFSDVLGRRRTLILCSIFFPAGLLIYSLSSTFWWFITAEIVLGFAASLRSGTDSALLYDSLLELNRQEEYKKYEGRAISLERTGTAAASLLGGFLALVSIRLPFFANVFSSLFMLPVSASFTEPERKTRKSDNPFKDIFKIVKFAVSHKNVLALMLFSSMLLTSGIISIWGYFFYFPGWKVSLAMYGVFFCVFQLASAGGAFISHRIESFLGQEKCVLLILLIPVFQVTLALTGSAWCMALMVLHAFLWGMSGPLFLDIINGFIDSEIRATVLSVSGIIGRVMYVVIGPVFGVVTDKFSLSAAMMLMASYFIVTAAAAVLIWHSKSGIFANSGRMPE